MFGGTESGLRCKFSVRSIIMHNVHITGGIGRRAIGALTKTVRVERVVRAQCHLCDAFLSIKAALTVGETFSRNSLNSWDAALKVRSNVDKAFRSIL